MPQQEENRVERLQRKLSEQWPQVQIYSQKLFKIAMAVVFAGLACDVVLVVSVIFWSPITRLPDNQLQLLIFFDAFFVCVVAPVAGALLAARIWRFLDNWVAAMSARDRCP